jgi:hypothetical protein
MKLWSPKHSTCRNTCLFLQVLFLRDGRATAMLADTRDWGPAWRARQERTRIPTDAGEHLGEHATLRPRVVTTSRAVFFFE